MEIFPSGNIHAVAELGALVRQARQRQGITQAQAAMMCGVGTRFLSDLENGKPTVHLGKVLQVLAGFGLQVKVLPRGLPGSRQ